MKIVMIDAEFASGLSIAPNPWLMKISSYHKQLGHEVSLTNNIITDIGYDMIYIAKETKYSDLPNVEVINSGKTRLLGKEFSRFANYYKPSIQVCMARPDYSLYDFEFEGPDTVASYVCLTHNGKLIKTQNQFRNELERAKTVIIDDNLWHSEDLNEVLDELGKYNKIEFMKPVDLIFLNNSNLLKKFINLRLLNHSFTVEKIFSLEELELVIKRIKEMKKYKNFSYGTLEYISTFDGGSKEEYIDTIKAIELANSNNIKLKILVPKSAKGFVSFIRYNQEESLFDFLLRNEYRIEPKDVINNTHTQDNLYVKLIKSFRNNEELLKAGFTEYGGKISSTIELLRGEVE